MVRGWSFCWWCRHLILRAARCLLLWAPTPDAMSTALTGPSESKTSSVGGFPPGSQRLGRSQVGRTTSCGGSRDDQSGSSSLSFGLPCGGALCSCLPPCSSTSTSHSPFRGGASGLRSPVRGSASGGACVRLPSRDGVSTSHPRSALYGLVPWTSTRILMPRAWQRRLSRPRQRVRRRRCPRPGLVQRPRPVALPLVRAH